MRSWFGGKDHGLSTRMADDCSILPVESPLPVSGTVTRKSAKLLPTNASSSLMARSRHATLRITFCKADTSLSIYQCIISWHEPYLRLIEKLLPVMPDPSLDSFFFWNSGSEAVEGAMKMARIYTGRKAMISMQGPL